MQETAALRASTAQLTVIISKSALPLAGGLIQEITPMKKVKHRRVVMVVSPKGQRRYWSVPVTRFKSTKAWLARHGFRVVTGRPT
jgi:hypothetical protein